MMTVSNENTPADYVPVFRCTRLVSSVRTRSACWIETLTVWRMANRNYSVSQKITPCDVQFSDIFSQTVENFKSTILHTYYAFLSTLDYKFVFSYLKF